MPYGFDYHKFDISRFDEKQQLLSSSEIISLGEIYKNTIHKLQRDNVIINDKVIDKVYKQLKELVNIADKNYISLNKVLNEKEIIGDSIANNIKKPFIDSFSVADSSNRIIKPHPNDALNIDEDKIFNVKRKENTNVNVVDEVEAKIKEIPVIIFIKGITVNFTGFKINYSSNNIISTCSFTVEDPSDTILEICSQRAEVKVILLDKEISYFGGRIVTNPIKAYGTLKTLSVTVEDYTAESADFIVAESYSGKITDILRSMWESYYEYDSLIDIQPSNEEIQVKFNYETLFDATEYLVKYLGWHWYVDFDGYTRVLKVFPPKTNVYKKTITQEEVLYETCNFTLDNNIVNAVYFFGGEAESEIITERITGDGVNNVYKLAYTPSKITSLCIGGKEQRFSFENSDDKEDIDVVVNSREKTLKWKSPNKPSLNEEIVIKYNYSYPIVVYMENEASIEQYGKIVKRIEDKKIVTPEQARKAAEKYLNENAQPKFTGAFETLESGIKSGMYINLDLPRYKAVGVFYVAEVEVRKEAQLLVKKVKLNKVMDPAAIYAGKLKELSNRIKNLENDKKENIIVNRFRSISEDILVKDETYLTFKRSGGFVFDAGEWNRSDFS